MYKLNNLQKVFKIIITFQLKNFNSKKKNLYTQTTDLTKLKQSAVSRTYGTNIHSSYMYNSFRIYPTKYFILQPASLVKLKVHFIT